MILHEEQTLAHVAYTLAAEKAEELAKHYKRIAWWIPWSPLCDSYLIKSKAYHDKAIQFREHLKLLGHGSRRKRGAEPIHDFNIPPRSTGLLGFGE